MTALFNVPILYISLWKRRKKKLFIEFVFETNEHHLLRKEKQLVLILKVNILQI